MNHQNVVLNRFVETNCSKESIRDASCKRAGHVIYSRLHYSNRLIVQCNASYSQFVVTSPLSHCESKTCQGNSFHNSFGYYHNVAPSFLFSETEEGDTYQARVEGGGRDGHFRSSLSYLNNKKKFLSSLEVWLLSSYVTLWPHTFFHRRTLSCVIMCQLFSYWLSPCCKLWDVLLLLCDWQMAPEDNIHILLTLTNIYAVHSMNKWKQVGLATFKLWIGSMKNL